jgi:hypothetical protein
MLINQADEPLLSQRSGRQGLVHVTCPGIPPGTSTITGRLSRTDGIQPASDKLLTSGTRTLPLAPHNGPQFPPDPLVQHFKASPDLRHPEVGNPAAQHTTEFTTDSPKVSTSTAHDKEFLLQVNAILSKWKKDGTLKEVLVRWLPYLKRKDLSHLIE